jgi:hypothetical protein
MSSVFGVDVAVTNGIPNYTVATQWDNYFV